MKNMVRYKCSYLLFFWLFVSYCGNIASQVNVPDPSIYYAFDTNNPGFETVTQRIDVCLGEFQLTTDRFGNTQRALQFTSKEAMIQCSISNVNSTHTVSLWVNITDPSAIPEGATPFTTTDTKYEFYNWVNVNNKILRGLGRRKATIGFNRYIPKYDGTRVPWYLWCYQPAQFDESGWYHIFIVNGEHYTRLIMYKPNGVKAYSYNWLGAQDFSVGKKLLIGSSIDNSAVNSSIDDFKVYNAELTDEQIDFLHTREYPFDGNYFKLKNKNSGKCAVVQDGSLQNVMPIVQNSAGRGNDEWQLSTYSGRTTIRNLHSTSVMVVQNASTAVGADIVQYTQVGTDNEVWIPEYSNLDTKYFRVKNLNSGKYLSVYRNSILENEKLIQSNPGEPSSYWTFERSLSSYKAPIEEGALYRLKNKKSNLYLSVRRGSEVSGDYLLQLKKSEMGDVGYDVWSLKSGDRQNGFFLINTVSDLYMTTTGGELAVNIVQKPGTVYGTAKWQFLSTGVENEYRLRNVDNYLYAVTLHGRTDEGAPIVQYTFGSEDNEIWQLERVYYNDPPLPEATYKIRNDNSYKLMVVENASEADNAPIIQHVSGEENSMWELVPRKYGYVELINKNSQKFLVVQGTSLADGAKIIQYGTHSSNGLWKIEKVLVMEGGTQHIAYTLRNMNSGLYAVVEGASRYNGVPVIQYSTGEKNKLWYFEKQPSSQLNHIVNNGTQNSIKNSLEEPTLFIDCKNDIMQINYSFKSPTQLDVKIIDLTGRKVYEGRKKVNAGDNAVLMNHFNEALSANQFYIISIRSADGLLDYSAKTIMSK